MSLTVMHRGQTTKEFAFANTHISALHLFVYVVRVITSEFTHLLPCFRVLIRITAQLHGANRLEALKSYVKVRIFELVVSSPRVLHGMLMANGNTHTIFICFGFLMFIIC